MRRWTFSFAACNLRFYISFQTSDIHVTFCFQSEVGVKSRKFVDLTQLIHEYIQRGQKNGLATSLSHPVNVENDDENESGIHFSFFILPSGLSIKFRTPKSVRASTIYQQPFIDKRTT